MQYSAVQGICGRRYGGADRATLSVPQCTLDTCGGFPMKGAHAVLIERVLRLMTSGQSTKAHEAWFRGEFQKRERLSQVNRYGAPAMRAARGKEERTFVAGPGGTRLEVRAGRGFSE